MSIVKSYQDLRIWKQAIELVKSVYQLTRKLPKSELYGLASQMQRAAVSVPSNIAEGHNRLHEREFVQFLNISLGSCGELETQLILIRELGLSDAKECNELLEFVNSEAKQIRALLNRIASGQRPAANSKT